MYGELNIRSGGNDLLSQLKHKLQNFDTALDEFARKILNSQKFKDLILTLNQENLEQGKRPDGTQIEKTPVGKQKEVLYERYTKYLKEKAGKISEYVTLYDTGAFYEGLKAVSGSDNIYVIDTDSKTAKIIAVWGNVLGITDEQKEFFVEQIYPEFVKFTQDYFKRRK